MSGTSAVSSLADPSSQLTMAQEMRRLEREVDELRRPPVHGSVQILRRPDTWRRTQEPTSAHQGIVAPHLPVRSHRQLWTPLSTQARSTSQVRTIQAAHIRESSTTPEPTMPTVESIVKGVRAVYLSTAANIEAPETEVPQEAVALTVTTCKSSRPSASIAGQPHAVASSNQSRSLQAILMLLDNSETVASITPPDVHVVNWPDGPANGDPVQSLSRTPIVGSDISETAVHRSSRAIHTDLVPPKPSLPSSRLGLCQQPAHSGAVAIIRMRVVSLSRQRSTQRHRWISGQIRSVDRRWSVSGGRRRRCRRRRRRRRRQI
jgi:hypothetical protein